MNPVWKQIAFYITWTKPVKLNIQMNFKIQYSRRYD